MIYLVNREKILKEKKSLSNLWTISSGVSYVCLESKDEAQKNI